MNFEFLFKYIIIGDSGVGKSCILLRFVEDTFNPNLENTIGVEFGAKQVEVGGKQIKLQIWDTAGQEAFQSITRSYYRSSAGALLVYDVTNKDSFENIANWLDEARVNGNPEMVLCLVANKCDLTEKRQVSTEDGKELADENKLLYIETSALNSQGVQDAFEKIAEKILKKLEKGVIDPKIEEFGVRQIGGTVQSKPEKSSSKNTTKTAKTTSSNIPKANDNYDGQQLNKMVKRSKKNDCKC